MCGPRRIKIRSLNINRAALTFRNLVNLQRRQGTTPQKIKKKITQSNFIFDSHRRQHPEITCSCGNARRCPPLSVPCCLRVIWWSGNQCEIHMRADACQQQGQNIAPDYWQVLGNVILYRRSGIRVWQERGEALPFVRVWRTHAIPHICSISDCISGASSDIRPDRLLGWDGRCIQIISVIWKMIIQVQQVNECFTWSRIKEKPASPYFSVLTACKLAITFWNQCWNQV